MVTITLLSLILNSDKENIKLDNKLENEAIEMKKKIDKKLYKWKKKQLATRDR